MSPLPRDREKLSRMEQAVRVLIHGLGEDLGREGLRDTPKRVAKALLDCTQGYHQDTSSTLGTALFHEPIVHQGDEGVVVVRDIDFASTNEETLLPFHGRCHVAYRPKDGVVLGLSKLARLTKQYAKRLQTQERLAAEIALALQQSLECYGVAVVLTARHMSNGAAPEERANACVSGVFAAKGSPHLEELFSLLDLEDMPAAAVHNLDRVPRSAALVHVSTAAAASSDPGVTAPGTPDPSEKDTDGDSDDLLLESSCCCDEMEAAMQQLLLELGENPHRPGLAGSARRYVTSLLASTSGYHTHQQQLLQLGQQQQGQHPRSPPALGQSECGARGKQTAEVGTGAATCGRIAECGRGGDCTAAAAGCAARCLDKGGQGAGSECIGSDGNGNATAGAFDAGARTHNANWVVKGASGRGVANSFGVGVGVDVGAEEDGSLRSRTGCCAHGTCCSRLASGRGGSSQESVSQVIQADGPLRGAVTLLMPFTSQCEHHMLPFYGRLMVSYLPPHATPTGGPADVTSAALPLPQSAVEQVVCMYTQRLQVQERITHQVADAVEGMLQGGGCARFGSLSGPSEGDVEKPEVAAPGSWPEGAGVAGSVMVVCDAAHMCMVARGVENHSGSTTTFAVRGAFATRPELRRAVLRLFREQR